MTAGTLATSLPRISEISNRKVLAQMTATSIAFLLLFAGPLTKLATDWWNEPDAGHGLLLAPIALYLGWKRGIVDKPRGQWILGSSLLFFAVVFRYLGGLAAELFTMRFGLLLAIFGLIVFHAGVRQIVHWWLPLTLFVLAIPLPVVVLSSIAFPLQLKASQIGASLLEWRQVPVFLNGNVIHLPGQTLFVTEACSGLRSLASLLSLGVLIGGLWLKVPALRLFLVLLAIPVAILLNGVRVFLTGFLVFFVDPSLGEGFMHATEGWVIFVIAFGILGSVAWMLVQLEGRYLKKRAA